MRDQDPRKDDSADQPPTAMKPPSAVSPPAAPANAAPVLTQGNVSGDPARDNQQALALDKFGTGFINYGADKGRQELDKSSQVQGLPALNSLDVKDPQDFTKALQEIIARLPGLISGQGPMQRSLGRAAPNFWDAVSGSSGDKLGNRGY